MNYNIILVSLFFTACSFPKQDQLEDCIKSKYEKNGDKVTYFLPTKQNYINDDLLVKKLKITIESRDGIKTDVKDSLLFSRDEHGNWTCLGQNE